MKKVYRKPLVQSEEILEQTSLACNITTTPTLDWSGCYNDTTPIAKNGAWCESRECDPSNYVFGDTYPCRLSEGYGVPIS